MLRGKRWIARCVGIAAANGDSWRVAAQRGVAGTGSSKLVAEVAGVSEDSPRCTDCRGCRSARGCSTASARRGGGDRGDR